MCIRDRVYDIRPGQKINIAAAQGGTQRLIFGLGIQTNHRFSGLPEVGQKELEQIALALAGVTQNEDIAGGLILASAVKIHQNVGAILIPPDIQPDVYKRQLLLVLTLLTSKLRKRKRP